MDEWMKRASRKSSCSLRAARRLRSKRASSRRLSKGREAATITFHMAGMGGKDLTLLVSSVIQLGDRLGLFNGMEDGK